MTHQIQPKKGASLLNSFCIALFLVLLVLLAGRNGLSHSSSIPRRGTQKSFGWRSARDRLRSWPAKRLLLNWSILRLVDRRLGLLLLSKMTVKCRRSSWMLLTVMVQLLDSMLLLGLLLLARRNGSR